MNLIFICSDSQIVKCDPLKAIQPCLSEKSTDDVRHFRWRNEAGSEILLTDVPGIGVSTATRLSAAGTMSCSAFTTADLKP